MKCHYEVLGLTPESTSEDVKKSYRKLALEWHPDKNLDRLEEAKETFQLIQQAYEVLIDPQERAWYDRHKEDILRGSAEEAYKDESLNAYYYYNTSCFKGYNDEEKGFYTVFRQAFENVAAEDEPFKDEDDDMKVPSFGFSHSSYEEVVHDFYAYWQSYCTSKSYSWVDQYNLADARRSGANRQLLRMMEKENKKLREAARKARNEEIRQLVAFVRKRDKRVQAHKKLEEERKIEKAKKTEELRKQQVLERNKSLESYQESEWLSNSNFDKQVAELETELDATYGASSASSNEEELDYPEELYCVACDKGFKTQKAMKNHEDSKKHKENVLVLKYLMKQEDDLLFNSESQEEGHVDKDEKDENSDDHENETSEAFLSELVRSSSSKSKKKKKKNKNASSDQVLKDEEELEELNTCVDEININENSVEEKIESDILISKNNESSKKKNKKNKVVNETLPVEVPSETDETEKPSTVCETCRTDFKSRNKLFSHLKESGHAIYKTNNSKHASSKNSSKKRKAKKF